jgi:energy-coupling factor transporter ATP-binding protein EcfA2
VSLELRGVSYRYAGASELALRDVSLMLQRGKVVGLVGPNGAGKSTLCLVAVGLAPQTIGGTLAGAVSIDGLDTSASRQHELAMRAGILFQEPETQLSGSAPTVWEEIAFGPRNLGLTVDEVVERTWRAVDDLAIGHLVERDPGRLSGGQAQLVALAAVLALQPAYLVLDEPTSQLDPEGAALVGAALLRAAERTGAGVLLVEHRTDLLAELCEQVIVLVDGAVTTMGPTARLLGDPGLEEAGVSSPSGTRLRRAIAQAGISWRSEWDA